jgi:ferredoxin
MRIQIDRARCEGHGMCQDAAPGVFEVDDDGMVTLLHDPVPAELENEAQSGIHVCPVAALSSTPT